MFSKNRLSQKMKSFFKDRNVVHDNEIRDMFDKKLDFSDPLLRNSVNDVILENDIANTVIKKGNDVIYTRDIDRAVDFEINNEMSKLTRQKNLNDFFKEFKKDIGIYNKPYTHEKEFNDDTAKWLYHVEKRFLNRYLDEKELNDYSAKDLYLVPDKTRGLTLQSLDGNVDKSLNIDTKINNDKSFVELAKASALLKEMEKSKLFKGDINGNKYYPQIVMAGLDDKGTIQFGKDNVGNNIAIVGMNKFGMFMPYTAIDTEKFNNKTDTASFLAGCREPINRANRLCNQINEKTRNNNNIRIKDIAGKGNGYTEISKTELNNSSMVIVDRFKDMSLEELMNKDRQNEFPYPDFANRINQGLDADLEKVEVEEETLEEELSEDEKEKHSTGGVPLKAKNDKDLDGVGDDVDPEPNNPKVNGNSSYDEPDMEI